VKEKRGSVENQNKIDRLILTILRLGEKLPDSLKHATVEEVADFLKAG
jgi:hypothetical protein